MEKLLHERLREHTDGSEVFVINEYEAIWLTISTANALADEIERYYIPRPRFEDGEPVQFDDEVLTEDGITCPATTLGMGLNGTLFVNPFSKDEDCIIELAPGELVKRTTKVLDADGVEIKVGDIVWYTPNGSNISTKVTVTDILKSSVKVEQEMNWTDSNHGYAVVEILEPTNLTHEQPVFDADGVRICKGDTVWHASTQWTVMGIVYLDGEPWVQLDNTGNNPKCSWQERKPSRITHQEPDSLKRLLNDIREYLATSPVIDSHAREWEKRFSALIERDA